MTTFSMDIKKGVISSFLAFLSISFVIAFCCSHLHFPGELAAFWPVNAIIAGLIIRYPHLNQIKNYFAVYIAMIVNDIMLFGWNLSFVYINIANMAFIVTTIYLIIKQKEKTSDLVAVYRAVWIFPACLISSSICATLGAVASKEFGPDFPTLWVEWWTEQFSTGVLVLPLMIFFKLTSLKNISLFNLKKLLPIVALVIALILSAIMDGGSSISFPLPALVWGAVTYPIEITCMLTFLTGVIEIILVVYGIINISSIGQFLVLPRLDSVRLGIAIVGSIPIVIAVGTDTLMKLNEKMKLRADYDFLTASLNRTGLYERLREQEQKSLKRATEKEIIGVMEIDVDFFKKINDNFGHEMGDVVLKKISAEIKNVLPQDVFISRFGGEEFVGVFLNYTLDEISHYAEKVKNSISACVFSEQFTVTASFGIAVGEKKQDSYVTTFNEILLLADKALYFSKNNGRNRITIYSPLFA